MPQDSITSLNSLVQVFVQSLSDQHPVLLDSMSVVQKTFVPQKGVLSIGNCSFRFDYYDGVLSPRREQGTPQVSY